MKNTSLFRRFLSVVLVLAMVGSLLVPTASAETPRTNAETEELTLIPIDPGTLESQKLGQMTEADDDSATEEAYAPTDVVRVSIVLEKASTLDAGFDTKGIAKNAAAKAYRQGLRADQTAMTAKIEKALNCKLDVEWNLTLLVNIISANIRYEQMEAIKAIDGVKDVFVENSYEALREEENNDQPMNGTGTGMSGADLAWADGYTGAGSRLAILDTGVDIAHQSFDGEALEYALKQNAEAKGMSYEAYLESLNLLTVEQINAVKDQLNANQNGDFDAAKAYHSIKIPFAFNYYNHNYEATHEHDEAGHHGSHVAGISAANRFIKVGEEFKPAMEEVLTQGAAPDAQILDMDVFVDSGGTSDSYYMAAIEDAIILGCDSANLSLGSSSSGFGYTHNYYETVMNELVDSDMVCAFAMGNAYMWFDYTNGANANMLAGYIYADDVTFHTGGSPATYTNTLAVAAAENQGATAMPLQIGDLNVLYKETSGYGNDPIATLIGEDLQYVFFNNTGVDGAGNDLLEPYADAIEGKVVFCQRGDSSFYQKVNAAAAHGAIACIIYNNSAVLTGGMNLTGVTTNIPSVIIGRDDGFAIRDHSEAVNTENGTYYTGSMKVSEMTIIAPEAYTDTMDVCSFSSYGVPGTLVMKPEILAPGGNIYSVYGALPGETTHDQYVHMDGTSMATPGINGLAGVLAQYIRENDLCSKTGLTQRQLINSLLMSTAHPVYDENGRYWPVIRVGAGHGNVADAVAAQSFIMMDEKATLFPASARDGKVKAELGDDPDRTGEYSYRFTYTPLDGEKEISFRTDIFTQGIAGNAGYGLLQDTGTVLIGAETTYVVNGKTLTDNFELDADVNQDGKTDAADAQAILDKLTGELAEDAKFDEAVADVDGDGQISSYDAKLILESASSPTVTVSGPTEITVNIKIDDEWKEMLLDEYFTKGFFVQGYTYVEPVADAEGAMDVTHSIPILGFCGSWTDPAMLDRTSPIDEAYGIGHEPYMGNTNINYMTVTDADDSSFIFMGNPYAVEESFPADRLAIRSDATVKSFNYLPIRNAANVGFAATNEEGDFLFSSVDLGRYAPYFSPSANAWQNTSSSNYKVNKKISDLGLQEGEKVTLGFYAVPEYVPMCLEKMTYGVSETGELDKGDFEAAVATGIIGEGAKIQYTVAVDDTAPVVSGVTFDLKKGKFVVNAQDDNYIAYIGILNNYGTETYAELVPEQSEPGEEVEAYLRTGDQELPNDIVLLVADYAGNEVAFRVKLGGESVNLAGSVLAFTSTTVAPGTGNRILKLEPETLTYNTDDKSYTGLSVYAPAPFAVEAAEYVGGYIFAAATDGKLYAMDSTDLNERYTVGSFSDVSATIYDLAYNYQDQKLYAMGENNTLYTVDLANGKLTKVAEITITNPKNANSVTLKDLAIDDNGNFYSANSSISYYPSETFFYSFTLDMVDADGKIQDLTPVNNDPYGGMNVDNYVKGGSMAWDHDNNRLLMLSNYRSTYATGGYNATYSMDNVLYVVNVENGSVKRANTTGVEVGSGYLTYDSSAAVYSACSGLIVVPSKGGNLQPAEKPEAVTVEPAELTMLKGMTAELEATVLPWSLDNKGVTWKSNDESIVKVNKDGKVTSVDFGETTITVTTKAKPSVSVEVPVSVVPAPTATLRGVIWDENGKGWSTVFDSDKTTEWKGEVEVGEARWGTLVDDFFYGATDSTYFALDADTNELKTIGAVPSGYNEFFPADVAAVPENLRGRWGSMIGFGLDGQYFLYFDVNGDYNPHGFNMSENGIDYFVDDPAALIAYVGADEDMGYYYVMTEGGELYLMGLTLSGPSFVPIGSTGIKLPGATAVGSNNLGSMVFDMENDFLYVSFYSGEDNFAHLYAIDASDPSRHTMVGDFRDGVWPLIGLYEYEPATDLMLIVKPTDVTLYAGETAEMDIRVKLGATNQYTVEIADPAVCSLENGVITALKPGETDITITTVDANKEGNKLSETVHVLVEEEPYAMFDFESDPTQAGWTFVDQDGDGKNWNYLANAGYSHSDNHCMYSASWTSAGALNPDNWMVSPAVDLSDATAPVASFYVCSSFADTFQIYAGTSANPNEMTVCNAEEPIAAPTDYTKYSIDLSSFAGQSAVYVALRHFGCTGCFYLFADDFAVTEKPEVESNVESTYKIHGVRLGEREEIIEKPEEPVNAVVGTTSAVNGEANLDDTFQIGGKSADIEGKVQVKLTETEAVSNGVITVTYDPALLTFDSCNSSLLYKSCHVDAEKGIITFAYASATKIPVKSVLATLSFSYTAEEFETEINVETKERNKNVNVTEATFVIPVKVMPCQIGHYTDLGEYADHKSSEEHAAIEWAFLNNVAKGTTETTFSPNNTVTRAEAMLMLYAAEGRPDYEMPDRQFKDVKKKHWAYDAIMWAVANGITDGTTPTTFSPKKTCTRAEILLFLYAAEGKPAYSIENPYSDVKAKHWYYDAAIWAYENGLETGKDGKFKAKTECTRLSTVLYLFRYLG